MPDRIKKHPKREERVGHQWFKPSFEEKMVKYFRRRGVESIPVGDKMSKAMPVYSYAELALHLLRQTGLEKNVPVADKPKLLAQIHGRATAGSKKEDGGKEKKKKKQK